MGFPNSLHKHMLINCIFPKPMAGAQLNDLSNYRLWRTLKSHERFFMATPQPQRTHITHQTTKKLSSHLHQESYADAECEDGVYLLPEFQIQAVSTMQSERQ